MVADMASQKITTTVTAPGAVNDLAISNDTILAVTNRDLLFVHSAAGSKEIKLSDEGTAVAILADSAFVGTKRGSLLKIELSSGKVLATTQIHSSKVTRIVPSQQGKLLGIGSSNGLLSIYSVADDRVVSDDLKYHNMPITAIAFYADDTRCLTAAHERDVRAWDLTKMKHLEAYERRLP